ncbi:hypothetical protein AERO9AM_70536 [Aeromicrobium sp. 9AM]|nr:hypothetical protein AERO9AM_70536 [Aeromicrobium sp. 9AM]
MVCQKDHMLPRRSRNVTIGTTYDWLHLRHDRDSCDADGAGLHRLRPSPREHPPELSRQRARRRQ